MSNRKQGGWSQIAQGIAALLLLLFVCGAAIYGLSKVATGSMGGALAGGVVALAVALALKAFEHQKQRDSAIAEKKKEVYRRLLAPWEHVMVDIKAGKEGDELLKSIDLASMYASAFDAVLYGSESVVQRYVEFRSPDPSRDGIDTLRSLAALLVAMREDVTGKKSTLSVEAVLGTFMNFSEEELVLLRLREYVATHPEAQAQLASAIAGQPPGGSPKVGPLAG